LIRAAFLTMQMQRTIGSASTSVALLVVEGGWCLDGLPAATPVERDAREHRTFHAHTAHAPLAVHHGGQLIGNEHTLNEASSSSSSSSSRKCILELKRPKLNKCDAQT
jgi:hypothetical protein